MADGPDGLAGWSMVDCDGGGSFLIGGVGVGAGFAGAKGGFEATGIRSLASSFIRRGSWLDTLSSESSNISARTLRVESPGSISVDIGSGVAGFGTSLELSMELVHMLVGTY